MKKRILERNEGKDDDNDETITKRIKIFEEEIKPIISLFETKKMLIKINGMKTVDEISEEVSKIFIERGFN